MHAIFDFVVLGRKLLCSFTADCCANQLWHLSVMISSSPGGNAVTRGTPERRTNRSGDCRPALDWGFNLWTMFDEIIFLYLSAFCVRTSLIYPCRRLHSDVWIEQHWTSWSQEHLPWPFWPGPWPVFMGGPKLPILRRHSTCQWYAKEMARSFVLSFSVSDHERLHNPDLLLKGGNDDNDDNDDNLQRVRTQLLPRAGQFRQFNVMHGHGHSCSS